jgi:hypothetical protein
MISDYERARAEVAAERRAEFLRAIDPLVTQPPAVRPFPFDVKRERLKMQVQPDLGAVRLSIGPSAAIVMTMILAWSLVIGIALGANLAWRIERMGYIMEDTE